MRFLELTLKSKGAQSEQEDAPFSVHEDSAYYIVQTPRVSLRLRKRSAYPGTYCRIVGPDELVCGYGSSQPREDEEYLRIVISRRGSIQVYRDGYATLPVFYGQSGNTFVLSNDYAFVCKHLPNLTLSKQGTLETLLLNPSSYQLIWQEIHLLKAVHELSLQEDGTVSVLPTSSRPWMFSWDAPQADAHDFARYFSQHLDSFIKLFANEVVAFEISGGLDSATLPLYMAARNIPINARAAAMIFPNDFGDSQKVKLAVLEAVTGLRIEKLPLDVDKHWALKDIMELSRPERHFYANRNTYHNPSVEFLDSFANTGVKVVVTGLGGDDCMENVVDIPRELEHGDIAYARRHDQIYPRYITTKAIDHYLATAPAASQALPPLPFSVYHAGPGGYNDYIERDIWPVSPFLNPNLYTYMQGLPAYFRSNKNILRLFHKAYHMPDIIYAASQNEDFSVFLNKMFTSPYYEQLIRTYAADSVAAGLGYVDSDELLKMYESLKTNTTGNDREQGELQAYLDMWLNFEINAHTM